MPRRLSLALVLPLLLVALLTSGCKAASTSTGAQNAPAASSAISAGGSGGSVAAGATGCPTSNTTTFAKTKFVLHAGLAFGAFHRYLYKPFRAGTFRAGAHGRIFAFVKAGLAALFIKREVRLAYEDAKANPALCKVIAAPLQAVGDEISAAVTAIRGGDASGVTGLEQTIQEAKTKASSTGTPIQETSNPPLP